MSENNATAVTVAERQASIADAMPQEIKLAVEQAVQSGLYGKLTRWEAATRIAAGMELGLSPMQSLQGTYIVSGKLVISYPLLGALVQRSDRFRFRVLEQSAKAARIEFLERVESEVGMGDGTFRTVRAWEVIGVSEFTIEEAKQANLLSKGPWLQYPKIMLFARALSAGVRIYCPSLTMQPVYTPGELDADVNEPVQPRKPAPRAKPEVEVISIEPSDAVPRDAVLRETVAAIQGANS